MLADPWVRERFIPIRKADLIDGLSNSKMVTPKDRETFLRFGTILDSIFHFEFHAKTETLKENDHPFNPDNDTVSVRHFSHAMRKAHEDRLMAAFKAVLNQANYRQITAIDLTFAMNRESLFKINLFVDFEDLDNNAGVFYHIIADAEEEEFKEALLGYVFLAESKAGMTADALDDAIEDWFKTTYDTPLISKSKMPWENRSG